MLKCMHTDDPVLSVPCDTGGSDPTAEEDFALALKLQVRLHAVCCGMSTRKPPDGMAANLKVCP
jgi:hypothetical protein